MRGLLRNLHRYVLWALISVVFWAWVFTRILDAPAGKKLVVYADMPDLDRAALSSALEKDMPEGIRFVDAMAFMDEMFTTGNVTHGDLFVVPASHAELFLSDFSPIDPAAFPDLPLYTFDGKAYGVCVYDEAAAIYIGTRYVGYLPGETYYLFFNAASPHLGQWNDSPDDAALRAARTFLTLP